MVKTYPLLAGIGITAGEGMPNGLQGRFQGELALEDLRRRRPRRLKDDSSRTFRLIHRFHQTASRRHPGRVEGLPGPVRLQLQVLRRAHVFVPNPPFIQADCCAKLVAELRTWLTVRNDDIYSFRWGDPGLRPRVHPDHARRRQDGRLLHGPGRLHLGPRVPHHGRRHAAPLVIQKQWYSFMLWGRLTYDPDLPTACSSTAWPPVSPEPAFPNSPPRRAAASKIIPLSRGSSGATST